MREKNGKSILYRRYHNEAVGKWRKKTEKRKTRGGSDAHFLKLMGSAVRMAIESKCQVSLCHGEESREVDIVCRMINCSSNLLIF